MGSATLYRNFPTREALVEAVYRNEVAQLCDAAPTLLAAKPPFEALRAWTRLFLDYVTAKYGMIDALRAIAATGSNPYGHSREMIQAALSALMAACAAAGTIRTDISPADIGAALEGIALTSASPEQRQRARTAARPHPRRPEGSSIKVGMKRSSVLVRQCLVCFIPRPPQPRPARAASPRRDFCTVSRPVHLAPVDVVDRVNHAQQVLGLGNPPVTPRTPCPAGRTASRCAGASPPRPRRLSSHFPPREMSTRHSGDYLAGARPTGVRWSAAPPPHRLLLRLRDRMSCSPCGRCAKGRRPSDGSSHGKGEDVGNSRRGKKVGRHRRRKRRSRADCRRAVRPRPSRCPGGGPRQAGAAVRRNACGRCHARCLRRGDGPSAGLGARQEEACAGRPGAAAVAGVDRRP
ncbi:hypothetical protein SANTM175S_03630 [Streptomyces antimycoticus]